MSLFLEGFGSGYSRRFVIDVLLIAFDTKWENVIIVSHHDHVALYMCNQCWSRVLKKSAQEIVFHLYCMQDYITIPMNM